jgi:ribulose 1,5-bisphosphate synthetase/thiazole synthase
MLLVERMLCARPLLFRFAYLSKSLPSRPFSKDSAPASYDVVIVGGGLSGLALAAAIGMLLVCI